MRILVDGDACPNKQEIKELAVKYQKEMIVYMDYAHMIEDDDYQVVQCEIGRDSVDMVILSQIKAHDLLITQDYGLAGLVLSKGATVLHVSGMIIDSENIDSLLMSRYISAKQRKANKHLKGPSKRTDEIKIKFLKELENILQRS